MTAADLVFKLERRGGRATLIGNRLAVTPAGVVTADLVEQLRASAAAVVALLRERAEESSHNSIGAACELQRFPDRPDQLVVRFCAEPSHWHADKIPTYDCVEIEVLVSWAVHAKTPPLPRRTRDALLDLKAFGSRVDSETIDGLL